MEPIAGNGKCVQEIAVELKLVVEALFSTSHSRPISAAGVPVGQVKNDRAAKLQERNLAWPNTGDLYEKLWRDRWDLNPQPSAPEADALSSYATAPLFAIAEIPARACSSCT